MDWFLYGTDLRLERVKLQNSFMERIHYRIHLKDGSNSQGGA